MLEKDPSNRPTINEVLRSSILQHPILMITEHAVFNDEIAKEIKAQLNKMKEAE